MTGRQRSLRPRPRCCPRRLPHPKAPARRSDSSQRGCSALRSRRAWSGPQRFQVVACRYSLIFTSCPARVPAHRWTGRPGPLRRPSHLAEGVSVGARGSGAATRERPASVRTPRGSPDVGHSPSRQVGSGDCLDGCRHLMAQGPHPGRARLSSRESSGEGTQFLRPLPG